MVQSKPGKDMDSVPRLITSGEVAVNEPWYVVHYMVSIAIADYRKRWSRLPKMMHLPQALEAALEIELARTDILPLRAKRRPGESEHVKLRQAAQSVFGFPCVWDANDFRLE